MIERIINKVLRANSTYGVHKIYENGIEFYAPGWIMARIVAYDDTNKTVYIQGVRREGSCKKNVYNESVDEIADEIISLLNGAKRIGMITYEPEEENKDMFDFSNNKPTYEELEQCLQRHEDFLWKQFGASLLQDVKYYQRTEYKPRIKSEEEISKDQLFCEKINGNRNISFSWDFARNGAIYFGAIDPYVKDEGDKNASLGCVYITKVKNEPERKD